MTSGQTFSQLRNALEPIKASGQNSFEAKFSFFRFFFKRPHDACQSWPQLSQTMDLKSP